VIRQCKASNVQLREAGGELQLSRSPMRAASLLGFGNVLIERSGRFQR
jgi:hypothetical protein